MNTKHTLRRAGLVALLSLAVVGGSLGMALAKLHATHPATQPNQYAAVVKCGGMAEDSAAHVRLVKFDRNDDGTFTLVYRCKHLGY